MKRFLQYLLIGVLAVSMLATVPVVTADAAATGMNIYALYLSKNPGEGPTSADEVEMGDAVVVESGGEYLLMDTGNSFVSNSVISYLKALGIKRMSIYVSHLHNDHFYGMQRIAEQTDIIVDKLYLPDPSVGQDYLTSNGGTQKGMLQYAMDAFPNAQVVYLKKGSQFSFGSVRANVLGPVSNISQSVFESKLKSKGGKDEYGQASGHYLNNQSLTTMLTCGNVKFLTTGDIEAAADQKNFSGMKLEEEALVSAYGGALKADILKMPHHGLLSSNSEAFINSVRPKYAFAQNSGYEDAVSTKNSAGKTIMVSKAMTPAKRIQKYGLVYLVSNEKTALHIRVANNAISLMRASAAGGRIADGAVFAGSSFTGWVDLAGHTQLSSGAYTGKDHYYMKNGVLQTGVQKIGKKYYNFGSGVILQQGVYKNGGYSGWNNIDENAKKLGYFYKPDAYGRAAAAIGFQVVKTPQGKKCGFYFDKKKLGERYVPAKGDSNSKGKKWKLKKIGKKKYLFKTKSGAVFNLGGKKNAYMSFKGGKKRAFDKKGRMLTGWKKVGGSRHYFNKKNGYQKK